MSLLRHSALAAGAAIVVTGSRFALAAIVARRLTEQGFGQFAYAQWLVDLAFLVCSLGATGAVSRYVAQYRADVARMNAFMRKWRPWAIGLPFLAGLAAVLGAEISDLRLSLPAAVLLCVWAVTTGLWSMQTAALTGFQRFDRILVANALNAGILLVGAAVIPVTRDEPWQLFALMACASGAAAAVGLTTTSGLSRGTLALLEPGEWRQIRGYAVNIWFTALLWGLVWSRGELPLVRTFTGDEGVARYAAAMTLFGGAIQGAMLGVSGVAPQLTRLWGAGNQDEALSLAQRLMDLQLLICGAGALLLTCLGPELLTLAFGSSYRDEAGVLAVLSLGLIAMAVSSQNHLLQVATDARFNRNVSLVGLGSLFVLSWILVPRMGLYGAALSRALTMSTMGALALIVGRRLWGRRAVLLGNVLIVLTVTVFTGAAVHFLGAALDFWTRTLLFGSSSSLLLSLVRDGEGRPQAVAMARMIQRRMLAREAL